MTTFKMDADQFKAFVNEHAADLVANTPPEQLNKWAQAAAEIANGQQPAIEMPTVKGRTPGGGRGV